MTISFFIPSCPQLVVSCLFWSFLNSFGIFWILLESFGFIWNLLESFGIFLESFGILRNLLSSLVGLGLGSHLEVPGVSWAP